MSRPLAVARFEGGFLVARWQDRLVMRRSWLMIPMVLVACTNGGDDAAPVPPAPVISTTTASAAELTAATPASETASPASTTSGPSTQTPAPNPFPFATVPEPAHPLDGLSVSEVEAFRTAIETDARFDIFAARFAYIGLTPPGKDVVRDFVAGSPLTRSVTAVVIQGAEVFDVIVDPATATVVSSTLDPTAQPAFVNGEFSAAINAVVADQRMIDGLAARGLEREQALCLAFSPGSPRNAEELGRRMLRISCYANEGDDPQAFWSRPVEGLVATYDLDNGVVLSVIDDPAERSTPVPPGLAAAAITPEPTLPQTDDEVSAAESTDPAGGARASSNNVTAEGSRVAWDRWTFRWHIDRRLGIVLNTARFGDVDVLYEAAMSDMFVPYQDPDPAWSFRTFLDAGEFGMGTTLSPLIEGVDCPSGAQFLAAVVPDELANPNIVAGAACVFEREPSTPVWRHASDGAAGTELVLRSISTVGNYDYIIDAVFGLDGSIQFDVAAAGIVLQRATAAQTDAEHEASGDHQHGELVAPGLVGVNHDHYLNFRLDLDVLGTNNRLMVQRLIADDLVASGEATQGRTSIWKTQDAVLPTEGPATPPGAGGASAPDAERWLFEGPDDGTGNRPAYLLDPMDSQASPIAAVTDPGIGRAPWIASPLWVTPYDPSQLHAGGRQLPDGTNADGLPLWTQQGRSVQDTDLVAWYTVGFHHVVRSEDLPIMPVHRASFRLVPQNVFAPADNPLFTP